jgi:FkbM family methyltransferase
MPKKRSNSPGFERHWLVGHKAIGYWELSPEFDEDSHNGKRSMRPTARVRNNPLPRTAAKLCSQYLKWFGNGSYKPARNGERWLLESLRTEPIRTVLDVGANVGSWSLLAAELLPQATIYALEVVPNTAATLRARVGGQDRIKSFSLGLAAENGTLPLQYNEAASTHATFTDYPHTWAGERIECPVIRGDEFLSREGIGRLDFLKLDVEGAEHLVLQGLDEYLQKGRIRFVQFEYGRVNILTHFLLRDFYQLFRGYGYAVGKIYPDYVEFRDYDLRDEDFLGPNYLACRLEDEALGRLAGRQAAATG